MAWKWEDLSLRRHANFVLAMLVGGVLTSFVVQLSGRTDSAWTVVVVFTSAAGALFRLALRLRGLPGLPVTDAR